MTTTKMAEIHPLDNVHELFHKGILLDRKSHLVRASTDSSAIVVPSRVLPARCLSITWGDDTRYWRWLLLEDDISIEVAELLEVCWLEIVGSYQMNNLTAGYQYEVLFDILVKDPFGLEPATNFKLEIPGEVQESMLSLQQVKPKKWMQVKVGSFTAMAEGEIKFSVINLDPNWKKGLVIAGVTIQIIA